MLRRFAGRLGRAFGGGNKGRWSLLPLCTLADVMTRPNPWLFHAEQRPKSIAAPDIEIGKSKRLIETWEQFQKQQVSGAAGSGSTGKLKVGAHRRLWQRRRTESPVMLVFCCLQIIDRDTYEANKAYFERVAQLPPSALPYELKTCFTVVNHGLTHTYSLSRFFPHAQITLPFANITLAAPLGGEALLTFQRPSRMWRPWCGRS